MTSPFSVHLKLHKSMTKKIYLKKFLLYFFIVVYAALLTKIILFKEVVSPSDIFSTSREIKRSIDLIPFKSTYDFFTNPESSFGLAAWNVLGNILLFIPLGIFLRMYKKTEKFWKYIAAIFTVSLTFEVLQYILGVGRTDIDDLIYNTIGGILGVFIYKALFKILRGEERAKTSIIIFAVIFSGILLYILSTIKVRL